MLGNATVAIVRAIPGGYDKYGDHVTATSTTTVTVTGAAVAPANRAELDARGRDGVVDALTLYLPAGTDILHTDQVDIDSVRYDVKSSVQPWTSPFTGTAFGIQVELERATG